MGADLTVDGLVQHRAGRQVLALDLQVAAGERLGVLGPNGAGKSTLLRLLAGVDRPGAGTVRVGGRDPAALEVRRRTALATQVPCLLAATAQANVEAPLGWRGLRRAERRARAGLALERLGAGHLAERHARSLSGGEAQRVSLARALATAPDVLLLDEPCAGLDAPTRAGLLDALDAAVDGQTLVHVTHRPEEALRLADRVLVLVDGAVRQLARPADLLAAPADAEVALLVGYDAVVALGGPVRRAGTPGGRVAVTAAAVGLVLDADGLVVVSVVPGAGATVVGVALGGPPQDGTGGQVLRAHLPAGEVVPGVGSRVRVELDPRRTAVLPERSAGQPVNSAEAFFTVS